MKLCVDVVHADPQTLDPTSTLPPDPSPLGMSGEGRARGKFCPNFNRKTRGTG